MSNFTFLTGASHAEEMVGRAAELGLAAIAIADRNSLAGVVRAHVAARALAKRAEAATALRTSRNVTAAEVAARDKIDVSDRVSVTAAAPRLAADLPAWRGRFLVASRLRLTDSPVEWVVLPRDRAAYGRLSRLLSFGKLRAEKGDCRLVRENLLRPPKTALALEGCCLIALPPDPIAEGARAATAHVAEMAARWPDAVALAARPGYDGRDVERIEAYATMAAAAGAPMIASNAPLMHRASRRALADVLSCIREKTTIERLGARALPNAEARLKSGAELARLFQSRPDALARTVEIAARCRFSLDELSYEYPDEVAQDPDTGRALDPQTRLETLVWEGLAQRYPEGEPERARAQCAHELALIKKLDYARYFLTVRDVVSFAEERGILVQGRGSAANSMVCYALRVTAVGPETASMVFERFVSEARNEPPDIDVDFEHERREEVIQHIYEKYGRERAGLCATVIHFRSRAAIREVGKAMGLSQDALGALASQIWGWGDDDALVAARLREVGFDPDDPRLAQTLALARELSGFPRHLSQHVGGFVITRGRLDELAPIENAAMEARTVIEWDKDDIDALGILKIDVLSLGMLTCLRKAFDLIAQHKGARYDLATLPPEDSAVYDMLCEGDSIGVFQVESRAQMNFLPRLRPRCFYDLVIEVAIVRPGPIQGDMVHPYLRRRQKLEPVSFPSGELEEVLGKTLGVPLFQEQAMRIAIVGAGFSAEEADQLRRALATFRKSGTIHNFRERFVEGMIARGYAADFAERCFRQIEGFGEYGFPESHAASFALLVYASAWVKRWHPEVFACALLNAQPMGFYAPAQLLRDARDHGVEVRPVCVNRSFWDNALEPDGAGGWALRLGFRQIKGVAEEEANWIASARGNGYRALEDLWRRAGAPPKTLERLAEADAFQDLGLSRRDALWAAKGVAGARPLPLFAGPLDGEGPREAPARLPQATLGEEVVEDYLSLRLSLRAHPIALLRAALGSDAPMAGEARTDGPTSRPPSPAGPSRPRAGACDGGGAFDPGAGREGVGGRARDRASAAGFGQGRDLPDPRGRDGRREHRRLGKDLRGVSPGGDRRTAAARHRRGAARGQGRPCDRRADRGSLGASRSARPGRFRQSHRACRRGQAAGHAPCRRLGRRAP